MSKEFKLKSPEWNPMQSKYEETNIYPLMSSPLPVVVILSFYLSFVLKLGPALMRNRQPYQLNKVLIVYNVAQVVMSLFLVQRYLTIIMLNGLIPSECYMSNKNSRNEVILDIWLYFATKLTELLDTVFFVLRKKHNQVSFLHVYHHTVMVLGTYSFLKYAPADNAFFIAFSNSLVHVFMYTYYGLSAMGPSVAKYLKWKKYITTLQLIQFMSMFTHYIVSLKYSSCPPTNGVALFFTFQIIFFLLMFTDFYRKSYNNHHAKLDGNGYEDNKNKLA